MLRWLYIQLIWLHPAPFRWRFGDDMLNDFDRAPDRSRPRYLADAAASLARQWALRPEFRHPEAEAWLGTAAGPMFQSIEPYRPRPAALAHGGLLAILSILLAVALLGHGGGASRFLIGVRDWKPGPLAVDRNSIAGGDLNTTVKLPPDPFAAWLKLARPYFDKMPVLRAIDADDDLAISPSEIRDAPAALRRLDVYHEGKLTAEECGLRIVRNDVWPPLRLRLMRSQFMGRHPVLAVLDVDGDGQLSAWEIDRAATALMTLDRNHDGYLTADEVIPFEMAVRAGLRKAKGD
jgi:hypothetical protein